MADEGGADLSEFSVEQLDVEDGDILLMRYPAGTDAGVMQRGWMQMDSILEDHGYEDVTVVTVEGDIRLTTDPGEAVLALERSVQRAFEAYIAQYGADPAFKVQPGPSMEDEALLASINEMLPTIEQLFARPWLNYLKGEIVSSALRGLARSGHVDTSELEGVDG